MKGKRAVSVSVYIDYKVDDAHKFVAALAFVDISKSPIQDVSLVVSPGQILTGFNALLRLFLIEAFQRHDPVIVALFDLDVERFATTYRCERNSPPLLRGVPPTISTFIWCNCLLELVNTLEKVLKAAVPEISQTRR
jgi:hypothetical protein